MATIFLKWSVSPCWTWSMYFNNTKVLFSVVFIFLVSNAEFIFLKCLMMAKKRQDHFERVSPVSCVLFVIQSGKTLKIKAPKPKRQTSRDRHCHSFWRLQFWAVLLVWQLVSSLGTAANGDVHADNKSYQWILPQLSILAKETKGKWNGDELTLHISKPGLRKGGNTLTKHSEKTQNFSVNGASILWTTRFHSPRSDQFAFVNDLFQDPLNAKESLTLISTKHNQFLN